jgi:ectoine hydroxylase
MTTIDNASLERYRRDGFLLLPGFFEDEEVGLLREVARSDRELAGRAYARRDASGGEVKLALSNDLGDDLYAAFVRCRRAVGLAERLLGGEVYHWHHKMILKEPEVGGAWEWHQDYGYWYADGCLFPDLVSLFIAVDPATRANGCLQVVRGSHALGRIEHGPVGDQTGADPERVAAALTRLEAVHVEMQPGDTLAFHANTLHRSDRNASPDPRWALICCYNAARNSPYKPSRHPSYRPLEVWPDGLIREIGQLSSSY